MIRINLLPVRQARKLEAARQELVMALAIGALVLFGSLGGWVFTKAQLSNVDAQNAQLQAEIDSLAADVKKVDEMEKFREELERKLNVISELRDRKNGPVRMIDELSMATPERLQLTQLEEQGGNIKIQGLSVSNEIISQFLRALDASPYFDNVYLENIEAKAEQKDSPVPVKSFALSARLVTPKPEEKPAPGAAPAAPAAPTDPAAPAAPPAGGGA